MNEQMREDNVEKIMLSPSYRMAHRDLDFLDEPELRPVRMQLELLKPEMRFEEYNIQSTIVVFGSASVREPVEARRHYEQAKAHLEDTPDDERRQRRVVRAEELVKLSRYYEDARQFSRIVSECSQDDDRCDYVICTGGGPGIMEAANRGAFEIGAKTIGLNISLPREQVPNPYITPELCFQFHYFAMRKVHFLLRAKALVAFPGGFGTFDELFQTLTLRQTDRMQKLPIILYGSEYWNSVVNFKELASRGVIDDRHLDLFRFADEPEEAWDMIKQYHSINSEE
jgi:uncharacterized protein (TIGR00730 family)